MEESLDVLVRRARQGEHPAFAELIRRHERIALGVAFAIVRDAHTAGDVAQDAFLRAWQRLGELESPERFGAWLCGIVRHLALDARRRIRVRIPAPPGSPPADPAAEAARNELHQRLSAALDRLDDTTRSIVMLRYFDGRSSKDIAALVDLSPAAVDMRLSRARQDLRAILAPLMSTEPAGGSA